MFRLALFTNTMFLVSGSRGWLAVTCKDCHHFIPCNTFSRHNDEANRLPRPCSIAKNEQLSSSILWSGVISTTGVGVPLTCTENKPNLAHNEMNPSCPDRYDLWVEGATLGRVRSVAHLQSCASSAARGDGMECVMGIDWHRERGCGSADIENKRGEDISYLVQKARNLWMKPRMNGMRQPRTSFNERRRTKLTWQNKATASELAKLGLLHHPLNIPTLALAKVAMYFLHLILVIISVLSKVTSLSVSFHAIPSSDKGDTCLFLHTHICSVATLQLLLSWESKYHLQQL